MEAIIETFKPEDLRALEHAAFEDNHSVIAPTHVIRKNAKFVGYLSIGGIPLVNCWLDSIEINGAETFRLLKKAEASLSGGVNEFLAICGNQSPLSRFLPRLGFKFLGESNLFIKRK